jgi:Tfp pilus assembly protein FimT
LPVARDLEYQSDMTSDLQKESGFTVLEVVLVVGMLGVLAALAWPVTSEWMDRAALKAAADVLKSDIRRAQRLARASGRVVELRVDPAKGEYVVAPVGAAGWVSRLQGSLTFGSPDNVDSDGVTFRDNIARFSPRPGLQNSFGTITVQSRIGARRVTVSITGHTSITAWNGREWR